MALLAVTLLGFGSFSIVQTILPLYVLALGGNATMVGVVIAAFSLPSVVLRPWIGRLVDEWSRSGVHLAGTVCLGVVGFLYLVPSVATVLVTRIVHGVGWAAFNTAGGTAVAVLAPAARRGEAAGIYNLMPGIANMAMPAASLLLLSGSGFAVTFAVAGAIGLLAATVLRLTPAPPDRRRVSRPTDPAAGSSAGARSLVERQAVLPMTLEFTFTITTTLFWVYPPVFATALGIPVEEIAGYYVPVGFTVVVSRLVVGRFIDRFSRRTVLLLGATATAGALLIAGTATTVPVLAVAGAFHALAASLVTPAAMAIAIERSTEERRGAAIATYSLGFQLGIGVGGFVWGSVIDVLGFPAPYVIALLSPVALALLVAASRRGLTGTAVAT